MKYFFTYIFAAFVAMLLLLAMVGCKTTQPIVVSRDSVRVEYKHDSCYIYERDSVFIDRYRSNDTVYLTTTKWQVRYKDVLKEVHDTITTTKTDTVQVEVIPMSYQRMARGFWVLLALLLVWVGFKAVQLYIKWKL